MGNGSSIDSRCRMCVVDLEEIIANDSDGLESFWCLLPRFIWIRVVDNRMCSRLHIPSFSSDWWLSWRIDECSAETSIIVGMWFGSHTLAACIQFAKSHVLTPFLLNSCACCWRPFLLSWIGCWRHFLLNLIVSDWHFGSDIFNGRRCTIQLLSVVCCCFICWRTPGVLSIFCGFSLNCLLI